METIGRVPVLAHLPPPKRTARYRGSFSDAWKTRAKPSEVPPSMPCRSCMQRRGPSGVQNKKLKQFRRLVGRMVGR